MLKPSQLIEAYSQIIDSRIEDGWDGYLLTFMFNPIPGSAQTVARQMDREVEKTYAKLVTRIVRKPASPTNIGKLPVWICCRDYPVPKHERKAIRDVMINEGEHRHAITVFPPTSRMKESLEDHFDDRQRYYSSAEGLLWRVHVEPITHDPGIVTRYAMKSLERGRAVNDDILILPRTLSEL
jgi:hypothetical protein